VYHLGIVDFLQDWSRKKKVERAVKIYVTRKDPDGLSVMHPKYYKERFQACMDQIFESSATGSGGSALASRNTSTQNLQTLAAPVPPSITTIRGVSAAVVVDEVMNPLQSEQEPPLVKKKATKKVKNAAPAPAPAPAPEPAVLGVELAQAVNTTAQLDESVDEFAEYLDTTTGNYLDTTAQLEPPAPLAAKPATTDDDLDML
jgi:hypothetical protein